STLCVPARCNAELGGRQHNVVMRDAHLLLSWQNRSVGEDNNTSFQSEAAPLRLTENLPIPNLPVAQSPRHQGFWTTLLKWPLDAEYASVTKSKTQFKYVASVLGCVSP